MKTLLNLVLGIFLAAQSLQAEWKEYTLENGAKHLELRSNGKTIYHFSTIETKKGTGKRLTIHNFFWNDVLALDLHEHEKQEEIYMGADCTTHPEAHVETNTWDYDKDGIIDVIRIGNVGDKNMLYFGRYSDGVFALAPTDGTFTALWEYLRTHKSEQAGAGQPAIRPESKSEGGDKPQSESEGRSR